MLGHEEKQTPKVVEKTKIKEKEKTMKRTEQLKAKIEQIEAFENEIENYNVAFENALASAIDALSSIATDKTTKSILKKYIYRCGLAVKYLRGKDNG